MNMKLLKDDFLISIENQQKALEAIQHAVRTRSWVVDTEGDQKQVGNDGLEFLPRFVRARLNYEEHP